MQRVHEGLGGCRFEGHDGAPQQLAQLQQLKSLKLIKCELVSLPQNLNALNNLQVLRVIFPPSETVPIPAVRAGKSLIPNGPL